MALLRLVDFGGLVPANLTGDPIGDVGVLVAIGIVTHHVDEAVAGLHFRRLVLPQQEERVCWIGPDGLLDEVDEAGQICQSLHTVQECVHLWIQRRTARGY